MDRSTLCSSIRLALRLIGMVAAVLLALALTKGFAAAAGSGQAPSPAGTPSTTGLVGGVGSSSTTASPQRPIQSTGDAPPAALASGGVTSSHGGITPQTSTDSVVVPAPAATTASSPQSGTVSIAAPAISQTTPSTHGGTNPQTNAFAAASAAPAATTASSHGDITQSTNAVSSSGPSPSIYAGTTPRTAPGSGTAPAADRTTTLSSTHGGTTPPTYPDTASAAPGPRSTPLSSYHGGISLTNAVAVPVAPTADAPAAPLTSALPSAALGSAAPTRPTSHGVAPLTSGVRADASMSPRPAIGLDWAPAASSARSGDIRVATAVSVASGLSLQTGTVIDGRTGNEATSLGLERGGPLTTALCPQAWGGSAVPEEWMHGIPATTRLRAGTEERPSSASVLFLPPLLNWAAHRILGGPVPVYARLLHPVRSIPAPLHRTDQGRAQRQVGSSPPGSPSAEDLSCTGTDTASTGGPPGGQTGPAPPLLEAVTRRRWSLLLPMGGRP